LQTLSVDALVDHAEYGRFALLSALLLFPRAPFVRLVVALIAGIELAYGLATGADQTTIIWMAVLLGLALALLAATTVAGGRARLAPEEQAMAARLMKGVGRARARHFIDQGYWLNGKAGEVLLREDEPVERFCYLSAGEARVMMAGRRIGFCRAGDVIGGLGFFSGETAAASVILSSPARFWCAPAERLKLYSEAHPELRRRVERSISAGPPEESALPGSPAVEDSPALPAA